MLDDFDSSMQNGVSSPGQPPGHLLCEIRHNQPPSAHISYRTRGCFSLTPPFVWISRPSASCGPLIPWLAASLLPPSSPFPPPRCSHLRLFPVDLYQERASFVRFRLCPSRFVPGECVLASDSASLLRWLAQLSTRQTPELRTHYTHSTPNPEQVAGLMLFDELVAVEGQAVQGQSVEQTTQVRH
eukprot:3157676-Rhodomonas_salina.1